MKEEADEWGIFITDYRSRTIKGKKVTLNKIVEVVLKSFTFTQKV